MLEWDVIAAEHLETLGAAGKVAADAVRRGASSRYERFAEDGHAHELWSRWLITSKEGSVPAVLTTLAKALWRDVVGPRLACGYRLDFLIEHAPVVEVKAVERLLPVHEATSGRVSAGLLVNFQTDTIKCGLRRLTLESFFPSSRLPVL